VNANGRERILGQLIDVLAEAIAPRVAELVAEQVTPARLEEPWRLLSVEEAAQRLGRSTRWVRDHKDVIGWVRLDGGAFAFDIEDLRRFARERRVLETTSKERGRCQQA
jgi:hypothetical protein